MRVCMQRSKLGAHFDSPNAYPRIPLAAADLLQEGSAADSILADPLSEHYHSFLATREC